jgi:hypothetical protein
MNRRHLFGALSAFAVLGFAAPALADDDHHHDLHHELREHHRDFHHDLRREHRWLHRSGYGWGPVHDAWHYDAAARHGAVHGYLGAQHGAWHAGYGPYGYYAPPAVPYYAPPPAPPSYYGGGYYPAVPYPPRSGIVLRFGL